MSNKYLIAIYFSTDKYGCPKKDSAAMYKIENSKSKFYSGDTCVINKVPLAVYPDETTIKRHQTDLFNGGWPSARFCPRPISTTSASIMVERESDYIVSFDTDEVAELYFDLRINDYLSEDVDSLLESQNEILEQNYC